MRTHADHASVKERLLIFYLRERRAAPGPGPWTEQVEAATQTHWCSEQNKASHTCWGQGSLTDRKLNRSTLSMPRALSCRMTGARFERCISGTVDSGNFSKSSSDKNTATFHKVSYSSTAEFSAAAPHSINRSTALWGRTELKIIFKFHFWIQTEDAKFNSAFKWNQTYLKILFTI